MSNRNLDNITTVSEYQSREALALRVALPRFIAWLEAAGVLVQEPSNPYELIRYRAVTYDGDKPPAKAKATSSVIYRRKDGTVSWAGDALLHWNWFRTGGGMLAQPEITVAKRQRSWTERTRAALIERDGTNCFFCGKTMIGHDHTGRPIFKQLASGIAGQTVDGIEPRDDITIEHLIGQHFARTEGVDVNHLENLVLAHALCNRRIGHRPVSEKMTYREILHDQRSTMWDHPEIETPRERKRHD